MRYYEPQFFELQELVPPDIWNELRERCIILFDSEALKMIDGIRTFFNTKVTINDWRWGGKYTLRGFRPADTSTGAKYSQHKFGRAFDMDIDGYTADQARKLILDNQKNPVLSFIRVIEDKVNWTHVDCRNIKSDSIVLIHP